MRIKYIYILFVLSAIVSCSKKDEILPSNQILVQTINSCQILAVFYDTVSQTSAASFLQAHNITSYTLYNFNQDSSHDAVIRVTNG
jgi:hypothetical protein